MRDIWNLFRPSGPQSQALHFSYEKAGLTLDNQPIPWNAEAVLVEASVRVSASAARQKSDFRLRVGGPAGLPVEPELVRQEPGESQARLFFRLSVPEQSTTAELTWRDRTLGQITLPIVGLDEFVRQLALQMPTTHVRLGEQTIACQSFVTAQCQGLSVSALLSSPVGLAPLAGMDLRVEIIREDGSFVTEAPLRMSGSQLRGRQAMVAVIPPRPRRTGIWLIRWLLGDRVLATSKVKAVTKKPFLRSLRILTTRFVVEPLKGGREVMRTLPALDDVRRVGPCFFVGSGEPGMAGLVELRVLARLADTADTPLLHSQEVLVGDGPMPVFGGMFDVAELSSIKHFVLDGPSGAIGILPLTPVPSATFTTEGGFRPVDNFAWSPAAEEQLNERLGRLLGGM